VSKVKGTGVELAPLPRDRVGPFLILGVAKDADAVTIEARWARSILWARQGKKHTPLGDVHWAREVLRNPDLRFPADVASLNADVVGDDLRKLAILYHLDQDRPAWTPIDPEPPAMRGTDIPEPNDVKATLPVPEIPTELPGVARWLSEFAQAAIDPWSIPRPAAVRRVSDYE
jgi:hypothetical protein